MKIETCLKLEIYEHVPDEDIVTIVKSFPHFIVVVLPVWSRYTYRNSCFLGFCDASKAFPCRAVPIVHGTVW